MWNNLSWGLRIKPGETHARDSTCVLVESGSNDNFFSHNDITHGGDGVFLRPLNGWVSTGNVFEDNDASYAHNNCFESQAPRNVYRHNKANYGSYGFWLGMSDQSVVVDNEASYNGTQPDSRNAPELPDGGFAGIILLAPASHIVVRGNTCIGNNGAGIVLRGDLAPDATKIRHWIIDQNTVVGNRWGIYMQNADWVDMAANMLHNKVDVKNTRQGHQSIRASRKRRHHAAAEGRPAWTGDRHPRSARPVRRLAKRRSEGQCAPLSLGPGRRHDQRPNRASSTSSRPRAFIASA